jgi:pimeloyl-ACP methyl ester carboxylesterase
LTDFLFGLLSNEYSGLLIALFLLGTGLLAWRHAVRPWIRLPGALCAALGFLLAIGAASHLVRVAGVDSRYPAPGTLVQVEGQRMHVFAEGPRDAHAIVWFPGGHVGAWAHKPLHDGVKGEFRSILLDRFGTGWSDAGPFPRTTAREADEVIAALDAAGERGPFIFAGHSFGGLLAANIARRRPDRTAAVVLLDPTPLDVLFYGIDRTTLASIGAMDLVKGLRVIFGLYGATPQLVRQVTRRRSRIPRHSR